MQRAGLGAVALWASPVITRTAAAQVVGSAPPAPCASCSLCGVNLIENPGAEVGDASPNSGVVSPPPLWTVTSGHVTQFRYDGASLAIPLAGDPRPPDGIRGEAFFAGGPNTFNGISTLTSSAEQFIDLTGIDVTVPVGTRSALVTLDFSTGTPSYNNGYADVLSLTITI